MRCLRWLLGLAAGTSKLLLLQAELAGLLHSQHLVATNGAAK
jgi:hypothetical protein